MELPIALGQTVANKYRVDRVIGAGGMGVVVAGFHLDLDQPVAIKFLNPETGLLADGVERFRREARAVARIHSEHVVRVLDVGLFNEQVPYMVMELLEGHDLGAEVDQRGALPVETAVEYVLQAIDAIAEAHSVGIVHRDLKPTNLFLAQGKDGTHKLKVLDFGISKSMGPSRSNDVALTRTASMIGSPLYMSPEQMRSARDVDARTDIWSLGAILYELLTAHPPYNADSIPALCIAVLHDDPVPLHTYVPSAPDGLQAVLSKCLARELSQRFASVAELAAALVPFCPQGRAHAERAERLLPSSAVPASATRPGAASTILGQEPLRQGRTPPASLGAGALPTTQEGTQGSWGKTDRSAMSSRRAPLLLAGLLAIGIVVLVSWSLLKPSGGAAVLPPADPPRAASASGSIAPTLPAPTPATPAVPVAAPAAESPAVSSKAAARADVALPPRASAAPARPAASVRLRSGTDVNAKPKAPAKPKTGPTVPDFGGRHY